MMANVGNIPAAGGGKMKLAKFKNQSHNKSLGQYHDFNKGMPSVEQIMMLKQQQSAPNSKQNLDDN